MVNSSVLVFTVVKNIKPFFWSCLLIEYLAFVFNLYCKINDLEGVFFVNFSVIEVCRSCLKEYLPK